MGRAVGVKRRRVRAVRSGYIHHAELCSTSMSSLCTWQPPVRRPNVPLQLNDDAHFAISLHSDPSPFFALQCWFEWQLFLAVIINGPIARRLSCIGKYKCIVRSRSGFANLLPSKDSFRRRIATLSNQAQHILPFPQESLNPPGATSTSLRMKIFFFLLLVICSTHTSLLCCALNLRINTGSQSSLAMPRSLQHRINALDLHPSVAVGMPSGSKYCCSPRAIETSLS
jgi:hypothetical protein